LRGINFNAVFFRVSVCCALAAIPQEIDTKKINPSLVFNIANKLKQKSPFLAD
jgi:hypothetical protein